MGGTSSKADDEYQYSEIYEENGAHYEQDTWKNDFLRGCGDCFAEKRERRQHRSSSAPAPISSRPTSKSNYVRLQVAPIDHVEAYPGYIRPPAYSDASQSIPPGQGQRRGIPSFPWTQAQDEPIEPITCEGLFAPGTCEGLFAPDTSSPNNVLSWNPFDLGTHKPVANLSTPTGTGVVSKLLSSLSECRHKNTLEFTQT
eukprot:1382654-Rhodomonas_salina.2